MFKPVYKIPTINADDCMYLTKLQKNLLKNPIELISVQAYLSMIADIPVGVVREFSCPPILAKLVSNSNLLTRLSNSSNSSYFIESNKTGFIATYESLDEDVVNHIMDTHLYKLIKLRK